MSSPAIFPFKSNIDLDRNSNRHLYLQLCDQMIGFIKSGKLAPSSKLPGSRKLSEDLSIHRKTVIAAYDELMSQGWIESIPARGTFVSQDLPIVNPKKLKDFSTIIDTKNTAGFNFKKRKHLIRKGIKTLLIALKIDDGVPDHRLAPIEDIAKIYRNITKKAHHKELLMYGDIYGNINLRKALVIYLNQTRGLKITVDNILITRGSQMGIYLASQLLLNDKKTIITGNTNYMTADNTFTEAGGIIKRVSVDAQGINTNEIETICKEESISTIYVTSHHHHPTTVTLSAERRMHLLALAQQYKFAIIEDDYDYDFHYSNAPILPLASNDTDGNVIYIGGFTKIIAPALRIGYFIAPKEVVDEAARLRRILDRQGDTLLEQTLARMISNGDVQRHSNKVRRIYKARRDLFCKLLQNKLGDFFDFEIPKGGMAVWLQLKKPYHWDLIISAAQKQNLVFINDWKRYDNNNSGHNGFRIGFAALNEEEIIEVIEKLAEIIPNTIEK
ncbi:PLP-dependent aminotransferase family protein [Aquimarina sp. BL5]|uniref:MocR-like pyridoxine biosynthesis transcription factor PdxR n=1 Tax=Aquimarina sp. BL5 TaxID=1714860 RepID=UPI000E5343A7|nr:PLP-dependent aminotransferase family protein [Aquimarina sp. BL5]AXT49868.1 PLP-dependent aminotransferase family protein [Aquimarina sp. BL5]RKN00837.1 aminotransferase class I/II-fold pyridoxal phosphate-dependent enzyme [Aquimarina sp. BL5]